MSVSTRCETAEARERAGLKAPGGHDCGLRWCTCPCHDAPPPPRFRELVEQARAAARNDQGDGSC